MRRIFVAMVVMSLVALALLGCSQAPDAAGEGDGLHSVVPDVVGMSLAEATDEIESAGYAVGTVVPEGADGDVTAQQPTAGYSAPRGDSVDLTVSR